VSNEPLNVGDVCIVRLPADRSCVQCQLINGRECTIKHVAVPALRIGCNGMHELGRFYFCEVQGVGHTAALHRSELEKKQPPKQDDAEPRADFTPASSDFVEDLQRQLNKKAVTS